MASPEVEHLLQMREHYAQQLQRCDDALALLKSVGRDLQRTQTLVTRVQSRVTGVRPPHAISMTQFARQHGDRQTSSAADEARRLLALATERGITGFTFAGLQQALYNTKREREDRSQPAAPKTSTPQLPFNARGPLGQFVVEHADLKATFAADTKRLFALAQQRGIETTLRAVESSWSRYKRSRLNGHPQVRTPHARRAAPKPQRTKYAEKKARAASGDRPTDRFRKVFQQASGPLTRDQIVEQSQLQEVITNPRWINVSAQKVLEAMSRRKEVKLTRDGWIAAHKLPAASNNGAEA